MKTNKLFPGIGILAGVVMIVAAIMIGTIPTRDIEFNSISTEGYQFGADYYTEQYAATKNASDNVARVGNYLEKAINAAAAGVCVLLLGLGLADIAYFGMKLAAENEKTAVPAAAVQTVQPVMQPAAELTVDYTVPQPQPVTEVSGEPVYSAAAPAAPTAPTDPIAPAAQAAQEQTPAEPENTEAQTPGFPE